MKEDFHEKGAHLGRRKARKVPSQAKRCKPVEADMGKGDDRTLWQIQIVDEKNAEKACVALTRLREPKPSSKSGA